jgi:DNA processing protein
LGLARIPGVGPATIRKLIDACGEAGAVFSAGLDKLLDAGIADKAATAIAGFCNWENARRELQLLQNKGIRPIFITDDVYPKNLRDNTEVPALLFYKGNADLNARRIVAIVGTRSPSNYGREVTAELIRHLAQAGMLVISGLALGIDAAAHAAALENRVPTVGILGHGFGHLYPPENRDLAKAMLSNGGLLTAHSYGDKPDGHHFPDRNKIVAALCDALIVVETGRQGGSLSTVDAAQRYNRPVFAVPGRIMETRSAGCNWLIREGKAQMLFSIPQLQADLGWAWPKGGSGVQARLPLPAAGYPMGDSPEKRLLDLLQDGKSLHLDELAAQTGQATSSLALLLFNLEMAGLVCEIPGKRYQLRSVEIQS